MIVILKGLIDLVAVHISLQSFALTALVASRTAVALYHHAVITFRAHISYEHKYIH